MIIKSERSMKYDVFVSYSRKDYVDDNGNVIEDSPVKAIIDFLNQNQISYWFDKDGVHSGREFIELIAKAITNSKMMLFVSSKNSNASIYTTGEIFEAIENKRLIIPIKIDDSTYNSKFRLLIRPLDYIDYSDSDAFKDLLRAIEKEKETIACKEQEEAKIRRKKELEENKKTVKKEIQEYANEVHKLMIKRQTLLDTIYNKQRSINISEKECPVCQSKNRLKNDYCQTCGWYFPPLSNIENCEVAIDSSALIMARANWNTVEASYEYKTAYEVLKKENQELMQTIDDLKTQLRNSGAKISSYRNKIAELEKVNREDHEKDNLRRMLDDKVTLLDLANKKNADLNRQLIRQKTIAFLLIKEFDLINVYCLYEGRNMFGKKAFADNQDVRYQKLTLASNEVKPSHFEIEIKSDGKGYKLKVNPTSPENLLTLNNKQNRLKNKTDISVGDVLYIGDVEITITDNFNK